MLRHELVDASDDAIDLGFRGARFLLDDRPVLEREAFLIPELR